MTPSLLGVILVFAVSARGAEMSLDTSPPKPRVELPLVELPAGPARRGFTPDSWGNYASTWSINEHPVTTVSLSAFAITRDEVSVAAWVEFLNKAGGAIAWHPRQPVNRAGRLFSAAVDPAEPIRAVSWAEAQAFCRWRGLRLPTEAQWERAARGPGLEQRRWPWGDSGFDCEHANVDMATSRCNETPVVSGSTSPAGDSPEGVRDLIGNVAEWVRDRYQHGHDAEAVEDPTGPERGSYRVFKGGSFLEAYRRSRVSARGPMDPETRSRAVGFRCVREGGER